MDTVLRCTTGLLRWYNTYSTQVSIINNNNNEPELLPRELEGSPRDHISFGRIWRAGKPKADIKYWKPKPRWGARGPETASWPSIPLRVGEGQGSSQKPYREWGDTRSLVTASKKVSIRSLEFSRLAFCDWRKRGPLGMAIGVCVSDYAERMDGCLCWKKLRTKRVRLTREGFPTEFKYRETEIL